MLYSRDALEACRQVLCDLIYCLADYESKFYLVGGWAVYYLLDRPDRSPETIGFAGTEDVDLAFLVPMAELETIMSRLETKGYRRSAHQRMRREVSSTRAVIVDLLGGKQEVQDHFTFKRKITGSTLAGEVLDAEIAVADLPACLALKAQAFDENPKDKDAYDIYYLVTHGGANDGDAAEDVRKVFEHPFIAEAIRVLHLHFGRVEGRGLRAATQMLARLEGRSGREAKALVRGSFGRFFAGIGMNVNY
jgi:hypothetical protein